MGQIGQQIVPNRYLRVPPALSVSDPRACGDELNIDRSRNSFSTGPTAAVSRSGSDRRSSISAVWPHRMRSRTVKFAIYRHGISGIISHGHDPIIRHEGGGDAAGCYTRDVALMAPT